MRFVSKYGRFGVQIRPQIEQAFAGGGVQVMQTAVYAFFEPGRLRGEERELAVGHWHFNGQYQEQDEVTMVPPDYRIGVFDSEEAQLTSGWTDEIRLEVEQELIRLSRFYDDFLVVPTTLVPPPWPRYDEFTGSVDSLLRKLVEEGHNLEDVLIYERANQNRPELVEGLSGLVNDPDALLELQPQLEEIVG